MLYYKKKIGEKETKGCEVMEFSFDFFVSYPYAIEAIDRKKAFKETMKYLETCPGKFVFVFTSTHDSWLDLIERFIGKTTCQCLKGIHVDSKEELVERIYKYCDEANAQSVVYH